MGNRRRRTTLYAMAVVAAACLGCWRAEGATLIQSRAVLAEFAQILRDLDREQTGRITGEVGREDGRFMRVTPDQLETFLRDGRATLLILGARGRANSEPFNVTEVLRVAVDSSGPGSGSIRGDASNGSRPVYALKDSADIAQLSGPQPDFSEREISPGRTVNVAGALNLIESQRLTVFLVQFNTTDGANSVERVLVIPETVRITIVGDGGAIVPARTTVPAAAKVSSLPSSSAPAVSGADHPIEQSAEVRRQKLEQFRRLRMQNRQRLLEDPVPEDAPEEEN